MTTHEHKTKVGHKTCRYVLSICGGGVRDVLPAQFLDLMQQRMGIGIFNHFDLVAGTSGGSLLALYAGKQEKEDIRLVDLFSQTNLKKMVDKSYWDSVMGEIQFDPVYDGKGKKRLMQHYLGDAAMGDLKLNIAVPVYNISKSEPEIFTTYDEDSGTYPAWQIADASSAAIPYYPAVKMINGYKYADGGYAANDPILIAYTEARKLYGPDVPLRILSLGTGIPPGDSDWTTSHIEEWGTIQWMCNGLLDLMMDAPNDLMVSQTRAILNMEGTENRLLQINEPIPHVKLDDISPENVTALREAGTRAFQRHVNDLTDFFNPHSSRAWGQHIHKNFRPGPPKTSSRTVM
jgi:predicted acylesterase/phospholipase RssA